ncbi:MAG: hypothetical protein C5B52_15935 [Bacteroidetes bacterium]|nr:MAG: hypothetical protein C5B52_15935 [Bacteroidota bacterium]
MYYKLWTFFNIALVLCSIFYIWFIRPHESSWVVVSQFLAQTAILLFLININMYFIFLVIRKTSLRNVKIRLAKFSRQMMKFHIPIALLGTTIIIIHAGINLKELGPVLGYVHLKLISGYLSFLLLATVLYAGYLRHFKASGFRRKFHLLSAMLFFAAFLLHMFIWF